MIPSEVKVDVDMGWTERKPRWFPLLVIVAMLVSCSGDDPPDDELPPGVVEGSPSIGIASPTSASPSASPSTPVVATCPNEAEAAANPALQSGTTATADIDGDGASDEVHLALDPAGQTGCAAFVVVDTGGGAVAASAVWEIGSQGGLPAPRLNGFVDIDGRPGNEILVDEAAGASTQFVGAFMYLEGSLERITVGGAIGGGAPAGGEDLFAYGGSVGHLSAVDCTSDDRVVISTATPGAARSDAEEGIYDVERRFFVFEGAQLQRTDTESEQVPIDQLNRYPEYRSSPFLSC